MSNEEIISLVTDKIRGRVTRTGETLKNIILVCENADGGQWAVDVTPIDSERIVWLLEHAKLRLINHEQGVITVQWLTSPPAK